MRLSRAAPGTVAVPVRPGDTLQGVSVRHGVSVAAIKRLNRIVFDDEVAARSVLYLPDTAQGPDSCKKAEVPPESDEHKAGRARAALVSAFRCRCPRASAEEARSYLALATWDLDEAVAAYRAENDTATESTYVASTAKAERRRARRRRPLLLTLCLCK
eukprot:m51a1_g12911 hypothetical protein (159) ;mRNA; r:2692-3168